MCDILLIKSQSGFWNSPLRFITLLECLGGLWSAGVERGREREREVWRKGPGIDLWGWVILIFVQQSEVVHFPFLLDDEFMICRKTFSQLVNSPLASGGFIVFWSSAQPSEGPPDQDIFSVLSLHDKEFEINPLFISQIVIMYLILSSHLPQSFHTN